MVSSSIAEPIDMSVITKLRSDYGDEDGSLLVGLIDAFVDETRALQQASEASSGGTQGVLLAQAAHRLKSAAGTLGARQVVVLCQRLEVSERSGDRAAAADALVGLRQAIVRARAVLRRIADGVQSGHGA